MANLLTAMRLLLALPVAIAIALTQFMPGWLLLTLVVIAIATDYADGKVARALNTASARGQLFDHSTDFFFVTSGFIALSVAGHTSLLLPLLIVIAFSQYVLDSYLVFKQKQLRMSFLGRWNGVLYFVPIVLLAISRLTLFDGYQHYLNISITFIAYGLILSTLASIVDRSIAPLRDQEN